MSLDFQLGGIANWEELRPDGQLLPMTQRIIFATMAVDIGHITEKNYVEFFMRWTATSAISPWPGDPVEPTLADIKRHIGLRTNVVDRPRNYWVKRIFEGTERELRYREQRDAKEAAAKVEETA